MGNLKVESVKLGPNKVTIELSGTPYVSIPII